MPEGPTRTVVEHLTFRDTDSDPVRRFSRASSFLGSLSHQKPGDACAICHAPDCHARNHDVRITSDRCIPVSEATKKLVYEQVYNFCTACGTPRVSSVPASTLRRTLLSKDKSHVSMLTEVRECKKCSNHAEFQDCLTDSLRNVLAYRFPSLLNPPLLRRVETQSSQEADDVTSTFWSLSPFKAKASHFVTKKNVCIPWTEVRGWLQKHHWNVDGLFKNTLFLPGDLVACISDELKIVPSKHGGVEDEELALEYLFTRICAHADGKEKESPLAWGRKFSTPKRPSLRAPLCNGNQNPRLSIKDMQISESLASAYGIWMTGADLLYVLRTRFCVTDPFPFSVTEMLVEGKTQSRVGLALSPQTICVGEAVQIIASMAHDAKCLILYHVKLSVALCESILVTATVNRNPVLWFGSIATVRIRVVPSHEAFPGQDTCLVLKDVSYKVWNADCDGDNVNGYPNLTLPTSYASALLKPIHAHFTDRSIGGGSYFCMLDGHISTLGELQMWSNHELEAFFMDSSAFPGKMRDVAPLTEPVSTNTLLSRILFPTRELQNAFRDFVYEDKIKGCVIHKPLGKKDVGSEMTGTANLFSQLSLYAQFHRDTIHPNWITLMYERLHASLCALSALRARSCFPCDLDIYKRTSSVGDPSIEHMQITLQTMHPTIARQRTPLTIEEIKAEPGKIDKGRRDSVRKGLELPISGHTSKQFVERTANTMGYLDSRDQGFALDFSVAKYQGQTRDPLFRGRLTGTTGNETRSVPLAILIETANFLCDDTETISQTQTIQEDEHRELHKDLFFWSSDDPKLRSHARKVYISDFSPQLNYQCVEYYGEQTKTHNVLLVRVSNLTNFRDAVKNLRKALNDACVLKDLNILLFLETGDLLASNRDALRKAFEDHVNRMEILNHTKLLEEERFRDRTVEYIPVNLYQSAQTVPCACAVCMYARNTVLGDHTHFTFGVEPAQSSLFARMGRHTGTHVLCACTTLCGMNMETIVMT